MKLSLHSMSIRGTKSLKTSYSANWKGYHKAKSFDIQGHIFIVDSKCSNIEQSYAAKGKVISLNYNLRGKVAQSTTFKVGEAFSQLNHLAAMRS